MERPGLTKEERAIWYSKFYDLELEGIRESDLTALDGMMDPSYAIPIEDSLSFLEVKDSREKVENGYCIMPDGHSYVTCTEYYPDFTVDMIVWWFSFIERRPKGLSPYIGNLRYKIWCPPDHINHGLLDPYDDYSGLFINETLDLGAGTMEPIESISRKLKPDQFGMSPEMEKRLSQAGYAYVVGNGYGHGLPGGCGLNVFKPVKEGGIKWASIGYGGYQFTNGKPVEIPGAPVPSAESMRTELAHNITERRHLKKFLGELYEKQHGIPVWED